MPDKQFSLFSMPNLKDEKCTDFWSFLFTFRVIRKTKKTQIYQIAFRSARFPKQANIQISLWNVKETWNGFFAFNR